MSGRGRARDMLVLGGGGADPYALPVLNQLAWWDAGSGVYSDTLLTTPATNGGAVGGWKDRSASALHLTQATPGDQSLWIASVAALNNKPAVRFVSSDFLSRSTPGVLSNLNVYTQYSVFSSTMAGLGCLYSEGSTASTTPEVYSAVSTAALAGAHRSDANIIATLTGGSNANNGAAKLLTLRRIAANSFSLRLNGVEVGTSASIPVTTTTNIIGIGVLVRAAPILFFVGDVAEVANYSADNYATIEPILAAKYGIPLP